MHCNLLGNYKKDFFLYCLLCALVLVGSAVWCLINTEDIYRMIYGFGVGSFCFILLIRIKYPQSLSKHKSQPFSLVSFLSKNKTTIKTSLTGIFGGLCFALGLPWLAEGPLFFLMVMPSYIFALTWLVCTSILTIFIVRAPLWFKLLQISFKNKKPKKTTKKLIIFFKSRPHAWKDPVVLLLAFLTWLCNSTTLSFVITSYSWRYHYGVEFIVIWWFIILTTFVVTLPFFRNYMFQNYGPSSIRLLGWNGPEVNLAKVAAQGGVTIGLVLGGVYAKEIVSRKIEDANRMADIQYRILYNKEVDDIRQRDPLGASKGQYPYYGPNDRLPPVSTNSNTSTMIQQGHEILKGPFKKG